MSVPTRRDMLFSVLFVGDENLLRHLVWTSAQRLGAEWAWEGGVQVRAAQTQHVLSNLTHHISTVCLHRPPPRALLPPARPRHGPQGQSARRLARMVRGRRRAEEGGRLLSAAPGADY